MDAVEHAYMSGRDVHGPRRSNNTGLGFESSYGGLSRAYGKTSSLTSKHSSHGRLTVVSLGCNYIAVGCYTETGCMNSPSGNGYEAAPRGGNTTVDTHRQGACKGASTAVNGIRDILKAGMAMGCTRPTAPFRDIIS